MAISFSGLASGMDTSSLIDSLMAVERQPIDRLNTEKSYQNAKLDGYNTFNSGLTDLLSKIKNLDTAEELSPKTGTVTGEALVSASTTSSALGGTYQIKSYSMAAVEKDVSQGYASRSDPSFGTGTLTLTIGTTSPQSFDITIDSSNNSLEGIAEAINAAATGVKATIINDGTGTPYRLALTGEKAGDPSEVGFTLDASGLSGGSYANPAFIETQPASQAHIQVDGIDLYSNSNTFSDGIPGVSLTLEKADAGATTADLTISDDTGTLQKNLQAFVTSYNTVVSFVTSQSANDTKGAGLLVGDPFLNSVKRKLQDLITTQFKGNGSYQTLSELGLETQKDGTLVLNSSTFDAAASADFTGVSNLLAGDGQTSGVAASFEDYLNSVTDPIDGLVVGRQESVKSNLSRIDDRIAQIERRLELRQKTLTDQFTAMEKLVSTMNSQSDYLTQQMTMLSNIWSNKK